MHPSSPGPAPPILSSRRTGDQRHQHFPLCVDEVRSYLSQMQRIPELLLSATLGREPEVELVLG